MIARCARSNRRSTLLIHVTIQLEQEVKFQLPSIEVGASKLVALGARVETKRHFESNILYDFTDGRLSKRDEALRLDERMRLLDEKFSELIERRVPRERSAPAEPASSTG